MGIGEEHVLTEWEERVAADMFQGMDSGQLSRKYGRDRTVFWKISRRKRYPKIMERVDELSAEFRRAERQLIVHAKRRSLEVLMDQLTAVRYDAKGREFPDQRTRFMAAAKLRDEFGDDALRDIQRQMQAIASTAGASDRFQALN